MLPERKKTHLTFRPHLALTLLLGGMLVLVTAQALPADARRYSDWSTPVNLGPVINSAYNDQQPAISKDGRSLYFPSNRPGGLGGFDMYVSQRARIDEPWGSPVNLGPIVNTASNEGNAAFSRDGHLMFFQSDRPGGLGGIDIWVSYRSNKHDDFGWQTPVNLGPVNTATGDQAPSYFKNDDEDSEHDGEDEEGRPQLYFGSDRPGGPGALDIYMSEQTAGGCFGPAVLVAELSSPVGDSDPSIRHDGLEIFFHSSRVGSIGSNDLWVATRESTHDVWSTPVNLASTINTASAEQNAYLSADNKTLFFASDRPGGFGGTDLYMSTRTRLRGHGDDDDSERDDH